MPRSLDQVAQDLTAFRSMVRTTMIQACLPAVDALVSGAPQGRALLAVLDAAGITGPTRKFIGVAANGRARDLVAMASAFLAELADKPR